MVLSALDKSNHERFIGQSYLDNCDVIYTQVRKGFDSKGFPNFVSFIIGSNFRFPVIADISTSKYASSEMQGEHFDISLRK